MIKWNVRGLSDVDKKLVKALNKTTIDTLSNINSSTVVPFHIGTLEKSGDVNLVSNITDVTSIYWNTPYAPRLYRHPEYNFRNGRIGRWADSWIRGSRAKFIPKTFSSNAKKELG